MADERNEPLKLFSDSFFNYNFTDFVFLVYFSRYRPTGAHFNWPPTVVIPHYAALHRLN